MSTTPATLPPIQFDPATSKLLTLMLRHAFPDAPASPENLTAFAVGLSQAGPACAEQLKSYAHDLETRRAGATAGAQPSAQKASAPAYPTYTVQARHRRVSFNGAPITSEFVGYLPVVRVPLPAHGYQTFETSLGQVLPGDHLVFTVDEVNNKYAAQLGYAAARVDLITPPRAGGTRFAAVSVFLGYKNAGDTAPSFYLLEAGMATGEAKVLFFGNTMSSVIVQQTGYAPTPFAQPWHWYRGWVTVNGNEPGTVTVEVRTTPDQTTPSITIHGDYASDSPAGIWPEELTVMAAARVADVADALGMSGAVPLQDLLAELGKHLPWVTFPRVP